MLKAAQEENVNITEFTVAPFVSSDEGKSYHEWFVEFENIPHNISAFAARLDQNLREKNVYYDDLIGGNILQPLKLTPVRKNGFIDYMKSIGKLGGQNKVLWSIIYFLFRSDTFCLPFRWTLLSISNIMRPSESDRKSVV